MKVRLHELTIATTPSAAGAGRLGLGIGIKNFDVRGTLSGSLGCTGFASASSPGDELVLDGSIGTVAFSPVTESAG